MANFTFLNVSQLFYCDDDQYFLLISFLRYRAVKRQTKWSAPKLTNFEIDVGPSSGTLMKPKNHSMGVGGLLVRELEREKDLKAEKD